MGEFFLILLFLYQSTLSMLPPRIELRTFSVWSRRDNHYTMEASMTGGCFYTSCLLYKLFLFKKFNRKFNYVFFLAEVCSAEWWITVLLVQLMTVESSEQDLQRRMHNFCGSTIAAYDVIFHGFSSGVNWLVPSVALAIPILTQVYVSLKKTSFLGYCTSVKRTSLWIISTSIDLYWIRHCDLPHIDRLYIRVQQTWTLDFWRYAIYAGHFKYL